MPAEAREDLRERIRELEERLEEAEETLRAVRSGEVDAIVASGPDGDRVYTLRGADEAYRVMVQGMAEGALTLAMDGLILFSNEQFATMVRSPLETVIGSRIQDFVAPDDAAAVSALLEGTAIRKGEARFRASDGTLVPVYLSMENLVMDEGESICLIVTDLSGQKRNEEIVAAEKLARSILEQSAEAILVVDPDGRISRASRAAERLAGAPVVQRGFDEVFPISLGSGAGLPFRKIWSAAGRNHSIKNQAIKNIEAISVTADGRKIELLLSAAMLSGPDSGRLGCVINLTDITERKRRERQLKFQADILAATTEAVVAIDPHRRVTFWNAGAERLYAVSSQEALGKGLAELPPHLWMTAKDEPQAYATLAREGTWSGENVHVRKDGTRIFVSSTVNMIGQDHGGGMFAVIRDISGRRKAEAVLRESEARERSRAVELYAMMEAVPVAVFISHDPESRNMTGNRMSRELLRVAPGANVSMSARDGAPEHFRAMRDGQIIPSEDLPVQFAARTGQTVQDYEFDVILDDGSSQCWLGNAVPLFDEAGRSRGAVGAFVDITERKRSEERLRQTQKLESIGLLAGGIAHDFNNLLVGVIGNASLAQEVLPPGNQAAGLLNGVVRTGEQLAHLTRQMLAYAGKGRFFLERLDLSELIPEMSELVQPSIPKKIRLRFELERELPPIAADRGQLQQVFMNLVLNAAEAIGSNAGLIGVKAGVMQVDAAYIRRVPEAAELSPGTYICLEVRDTGCGMDPATRLKIFDPFFTTKFTGRGLGLAAVSGIVRGHKGAIQVESVPGAGTCFTVLFPSAAGAPESRQAAATSRTGPRGSGTVLVVDDERVVREMVQTALSRYGFDVLLASNGLEAIDVFKRHPGDISLVVLDLSMPGMSGEEALPEMRKIRPGVKVVVSSGYSEAETMALFKHQRVSGFIQKPYTPLRLAEKVKVALE